eukprot:2182584-Rhodomonas_salina.3
MAGGPDPYPRAVPTGMAQKKMASSEPAKGGMRRSGGGEEKGGGGAGRRLRRRRRRSPVDVAAVLSVSCRCCSRELRPSL